MAETITAAEASRTFAKLLQAVREGHEYVITSDGQAIARIIPAATEPSEKERAWARLLERWASQPTIDIGPWTREELYEDDVEGSA